MKIVKCRRCGKQFKAREWLVRQGWGRYCSQSCKNKAQLKGKKFNCEYCGKVVYRSPTKIRRSKDRRFFCSKSCHCSWKNRNMRNLESAPNWKGGESIYRDILIRAKIKQICSRCGIKEKRVLVAHHLNGNRKDNDVENLKWFCRNCHHIIHHYSEV